MNPEVLLAIGYALALLLGALVLEWLSVHTHQRSQRFRTSGFNYDEQQDYWVCHQGEQLWPSEYDREKRIVRYRAKPAVCLACPARDSCTDDKEGREITRPIDPWPHSEAGRFHRGIAVMMVGLAMFVLTVELTRHHAATEAVLLAGALGLTLFLGYWLGRDLLRTPTGFPETMPAHGNRLKANREIRDEHSGPVHADFAPDPELAAEGESGIPASRRREWWDAR